MASRCVPGPNDGITTVVIVSKYRLECKEDFFVVSENSEEKAICSFCGGTLRRRDTRRRVYKEAGGKKSWFLINRLKCTNKECGKLHNELPDCIVPYKHYGSEIIEDVLDEVVGPDDLETENYPCEGIMKHWNRKVSSEGGSVHSGGAGSKGTFRRGTEPEMEVFLGGRLPKGSA